jgi:PAS domain S-box-containing protein
VTRPESRDHLVDHFGDAAPVGLAAFDPDARILTLNSWMAGMSGASTTESVDRPVRDVLPDFADRIEKAVAAVVEHRRPLYAVDMSGHHQLVGEWRTAEATFFPLLDRDHTVVGVGCTVIDTTTSKQALRRMGLLRDALAAVASAPHITAAADAIVSRVADAIGADGAGIAFPTDDEDALEFVAVAGVMAGRISDQYRRMPLAVSAPATDAFKEGRTICLGDPDEWQAAYPDGANMIRDGARAALATPLVGITGRKLGILGLIFTRELQLDDEDLGLVTSFAQQAAQALERIVLFETEQRTRSRFELLAEVGTRLEVAIGLRARINAFLDTVIPKFSNGALVELIGPHDTLRVVRHQDPSLEEGILKLRALRTNSETDSPLSRVIESGQPLLLPVLRDDHLGAEEADAIRARLPASQRGAFIPLRARGTTFGGVVLGRDEWGPGDFDLAVELVRRLAVALDNARLYERERKIAETLQLSLLPDRVPEMSDVQLWARYLPGTDLAVGGDFWDALEHPDGRVALVVGDVAGRGERAAVVMGRIRTVLRANATTHDTPSSLLAMLNQFMIEHEDEMVTCVCAFFDPTTFMVTVANAGHPPVLLMRGDGTQAFVGRATGLPLGVRAFATYTHEQFAVSGGDTLLLFTDGLIERRDEAIDKRLEALARVATGALPVDDGWCDRILAEMIGENRDDDVALLGVMIEPREADALRVVAPAELVRLRGVRDRVRAWLLHRGVSNDDVEAIVVSVGEASANAAMHAYGATGGQIRVRGAVRDGAIHMSIEDDGNWRRALDDKGTGLRIIRQLSDEVTVERRPDGTTIHFSRALSTS